MTRIRAEEPERNDGVAKVVRETRHGDELVSYLNKENAEKLRDELDDILSDTDN